MNTFDTLMSHPPTCIGRINACLLSMLINIYIFQKTGYNTLTAIASYDEKNDMT